MHFFSEAESTEEKKICLFMYILIFRGFLNGELNARAFLGIEPKTPHF